MFLKEYIQVFHFEAKVNCKITLHHIIISEYFIKNNETLNRALKKRIKYRSINNTAGISNYSSSSLPFSAAAQYSSRIKCTTFHKL